MKTYNQHNDILQIINNFNIDNIESKVINSNLLYNKYFDTNYSLIHLLCLNDNEEYLKILLKYDKCKSIINELDINNENGLFLACYNKNINIFLLLIKFGCNLFALNKNDECCFDKIIDINDRFAFCTKLYNLSLLNYLNKNDIIFFKFYYNLLIKKIRSIKIKNDIKNIADKNTINLPNINIDINKNKLYNDITESVNEYLVKDCKQIDFKNIDNLNYNPFNNLTNKIIIKDNKIFSNIKKILVDNISLEDEKYFKFSINLNN